MNLKVLGHRIYVRLDPVEEKQIRGIIVPRDHKERTRVGTIVSCGPEVGWDYKAQEFKANRLNPGDRVLLSYYAGVTLQLVMEGWTDEDDTHRIIVEDEVLAVLED